jgi:hypothetical protein
LSLRIGNIERYSCEQGKRRSRRRTKRRRRRRSNLNIPLNVVKA